MTVAETPLVAALLADLSADLAGYEDPVVFGACCDGAIYAAARKSRETLYKKIGLVLFPKSRFSAPTDYLVLRWQSGTTKSVFLAGESLVATFVQPYPGGVLLVAGRCHWRPDEVEMNAVAVDWSGAAIARFTLGDGIKDLRVTPNGTIWASYFDEGVYGNYGWNTPGPMGAAGLVAFDLEGRIARSYDPEAADTDHISDAYALNVAGDDDLWLYFYDEFPIVHMDRQGYRVWRFGVGGAAALAVRDRRLLLAGDYKRRNLVRSVELGEDGEARVVGEHRFVTESGEPLEDTVCCGVGAALYLFKDRRVFVVRNW